MNEQKTNVKTVYVDANDSSSALFNELGLFDRLSTIGDLTIHNGIPETPADFVSVVGDAQIIIVGGTLPDEVLEQAPNLQLIAYIGQGASNFINLPLASINNIEVANTPSYGDLTVAEHAVALLLAVARRIPEGDRHVREGYWRPFAAGMDISGKTIGIIGYGGIGVHAARLFSALGMNVLVWNRTPASEANSNVEFVSSLPEIFQKCDAISLHLGLNQETYGIISGDMLDRLPRGAIVINTARSELIEASALEERLAQGLLAAGIDVFEQEPPACNDRLLELDNVVLTPHQGYNTPRASSALATMVVENIENFLNGNTFHAISAPNKP